MKKDKGSLMSIFPVFISIMAVAVILLFYIGWMSNVDKKDEVRQIGRTYMLAMETQGCLTGSMESTMRQKLAAVGVENIDLTGTTTSEVGYGNAIGLRIRGDLRVLSYEMGGFLQLVRNTRTIPIDIYLESTAKN